ncbi:MAG: hypothetical protein RI949_2205 [Pseudomonadota bacterium]|jgi:cytochrome b
MDWVKSAEGEIRVNVRTDGMSDAKMISSNESSGGQAVRVWDLPTRLFHWALAACVVGSFVTAKVGGNAMQWHFYLGYAALALLIFRILWGWVGGRWSRFASFLYSPAALGRYLRRQRNPGDRFDVGHSPTGALSVFALLGLLCVQALSGLFADDEIANVGPLNRFVSNAVAHALTEWHHEVGESVLLGLVLLHVGAVIFYRKVLRKDLITPMVRGDKILPPGTPASTDTFWTRLLALALALGSAALVWGLLRLAS